MRSSLTLLGVAVSGLAACTLPAPEPAPEQASTTATAIIVVERTEALRGVESLERARPADAILARFVRVRPGAVDESALRMAGITEDVPAPGTCTTPVETVPVASNRSVELLDVGQVVLGAEKSTVLLPRVMPDPAGVVSGYFYSSRAADAFAGGSRISLRALGGADLAEGFSVDVTTPRELTDVHVVGAAAGLDVAWEKGDAADTVYVDVLGPRLVARCAGTDSGHLVVPASSLAGLEEGQLSVHRLHKATFKAKGIDPGEVRFDVAKVLAFHR